MDRPPLWGKFLFATVMLGAAVAFSGAGTGCASSPAKSKRADAAALAARPGSASSQAQVLGADFGNGTDGQGDPERSPEGARRNRLRVVQLEIYRLRVPQGAISRSEEFWKHVDEQQVDVGTYDLLRKNGWRVGTARSDEWPYFRDIIDGYPASSKPYMLPADKAGGASSLEVPMREGVSDQNIFYFGDDNRLWGRSYERCDNLLSISLEQAPRKAGEARVTVCPTVRSLRRRLEVNTRGEERQIRRVFPERLYDLNLRADVPEGDFLVIAPSPEVRWRTSLGAAFLLEDGAAERAEHLLLIVPRVDELEETTRPAAPQPPAGQ